MKPSIKQITNKKQLPLNYPNQVDDVIKSISFDMSNVEILGSMSFRSMLYASDFDCYEIVNMSSIKAIATKFKKMIQNLLKKPNIYLADIKIGQVDDWEVIDEFEDFDDFDYKDVERKVFELYKNKIISEKEKNYLKRNPTEIEFINMKKELRFHILRWTPQEILKGEKIHRGKKVSLEEAMLSKGLFKLDCFARNSSLQEFSIIYELRIKNRRINFKKVDFLSSIEEAIKYYSDKGDWFKVCKRMFSLYNYKLQYTNKDHKKSVDKIEKLFHILNSDLGILYQIHGDIDVMIELLSNYNNFKVEYIKNEIDGFIERLSNVYSVQKFINVETPIIKTLDKIYKSKDKKLIIEDLRNIDNKITSILNETSKERMKDLGIL